MGVFSHLAGDIPFIQKAFFRNVVALLVSVAMISKNGFSISISKGSLKWLFIRSAAGSIGIFANFYALDRIPIADAAILNKMSPFFAILFSFFILKEKIKPFPLFCIVLAFLGSMFVVKPSRSMMTSFPAVVAFVGGMVTGLAYTSVRKLGKLECEGPVIIAFFSAFSCVAAVPFLLFGFEPMTLKEIFILVLAGIAASGGQFGITYAYFNAASRDISVYDYSQIIFSALLGLVFFRQIPDRLSLAGYGIIILMAIFVFVYNKKGKIESKTENRLSEK